jgi:hypothetical protein
MPNKHNPMSQWAKEWTDAKHAAEDPENSDAIADKSWSIAGVIAELDDIPELEAEAQEQARIIGMGAERELALMGEVARLRSELTIWQTALVKSQELVDSLRAQGARVLDGFKLVAVKGFDDLMYWMQRCADKGHLENCFDLVEPWTAFEWEEISSAPTAPQVGEKHWTENEPVRLADSRIGRVYIAGPMTGIAEFNFPAFNAEAARLRAEGLTVLNPAEHGIVDGAEWADYLRHDIAGLASCERIHFLPGWANSKGARLEHAIAESLGMTMTHATTRSQQCK